MVTRSAMRTSFGIGRYGPADYSYEADFVCSSAPGYGDKPALVILHPHGADAESMFDIPEWTELYRDLSESYVVSISDAGGVAAWGNGRSVGAVSYIKAQLQGQWGARPGKFGMLAISMGGSTMFNYANAAPAEVAFCAGIVPLISVGDLKDHSPAYAYEIDAAYGGAYSDAGPGQTNSPYVYRNSYPDNQVRTGIWHSPADEVVRDIYTVPFLDANPAIESWSLRSPAGVGYDHGGSVVPAIHGQSGYGALDFPKIGDWCLERRNDSF